MSSDLHTFYQDIPAEIVAKLQKIKLVVFDVDGTLTDGHIVLDDTSREYKFFDSKDGMGVSLLQKAGLKVALLTGRYSYLTTRRAQELQIKYVIQGERDKEDALLNLLHELQVQPEELAVMGDDINDLPMFKHAAVSAAPADGYHYMRTIATIKLTRNGGRGAARATQKPLSRLSLASHLSRQCTAQDRAGRAGLALHIASRVLNVTRYFLASSIVSSFSALRALRFPYPNKQATEYTLC